VSHRDLFSPNITTTTLLHATTTTTTTTTTSATFSSSPIRARYGGGISTVQGFEISFVNLTIQVCVLLACY